MAKVAKRRERYVIDYYDHQGKRRWFTMPADATLKQAKDKLREIEDSIAMGVYLPAKQVPTFKEVAEAWLSHKRANVRGNTLTMYDGHVKNHFETVNASRINRITVATVANVTDVLDYLKWDRFGIAPEIWMGIILIAVLGIAALMNFTRRDVAYAAVLLWALAGISVKQASVPAVVIPTWITFGLVALTLAVAFFVHKPGQVKKVTA